MSKWWRHVVINGKYHKDRNRLTNLDPDMLKDSELMQG
jgi:hypothetical protein